MVGNCIKSYEGILYSYDPDVIVKNGTVNPSLLSDNPEEAKILIAMTLAIFSGLMQVLNHTIKKVVHYKFTITYITYTPSLFWALLTEELSRSICAIA